MNFETIWYVNHHYENTLVNIALQISLSGIIQKLCFAADSGSSVSAWELLNPVLAQWHTIIFCQFLVKCHSDSRRFIGIMLLLSYFWRLFLAYFSSEVLFFAQLYISSSFVLVGSQLLDGTILSNICLGILIMVSCLGSACTFDPIPLGYPKTRFNTILHEGQHPRPDVTIHLLFSDIYCKNQFVLKTFISVCCKCHFILLIVIPSPLWKGRLTMDYNVICGCNVLVMTWADCATSRSGWDRKETEMNWNKTLSVILRNFNCYLNWFLCISMSAFNRTHIYYRIYKFTFYLGYMHTWVKT